MTEFETNSTFDSIIIIESLPVEESQTGLCLQREVLYTECVLNSTALSYFNCNDRQQFFMFFKKLEDNLSLHDNSIIGGGAECPILHFEIHGTFDKSGLVLKNNENINWLEFNECCRRINKMTKNNLIVVLAVCNGYYSAQKAILTQLTPYYALIAPPDIIYVNEIKKIFPRFYRTIFSSGDLMLAFKKVNENCMLFHCEKILMEILAHYYISYCEGEALKSRANSILNKLLSNKPGIKTKYHKEKIIKALKLSADMFDNYKKSFLLSDHKENVGRFSLMNDDVLRYVEIIRPNFT